MTTVYMADDVTRLHLTESMLLVVAGDALMAVDRDKLGTDLLVTEFETVMTGDILDLALSPYEEDVYTVLLSRSMVEIRGCEVASTEAVEPAAIGIEYGRTHGTMVLLEPRRLVEWSQGESKTLQEKISYETMFLAMRRVEGAVIDG